MSRRMRPGRTPVQRLVEGLLCVVAGHDDVHIPGRPVECVHCGRLHGRRTRRRR